MDALKGNGPFTVFAPTNRAFEKLPKGTVEALLQNPDQLKGILLYHVAAGSLMAKDVVKLSSLMTSDGLPVVVRTTGRKVYINNARITMTDIQATNGVIHVIDAVLLPPAKDIVDTAVSNPDLSTLVSAV